MFGVPNAVVDQYLKLATPSQLKVLLYLLRNNGQTVDHSEIAKALAISEELVEEAGLGPKQKLIGRAVDLAVYMEKTPDNRRQISSIIKVNKFNHKEDFYETETLYLASAA